MTRDKLPLAKTSYEDKFNILSRDVRTLIDNPLFKEHFGNTANYLREQLKEWEDE